MSIKVGLELDDGSFTTRMIHAGETVQQFQRNVGGTISSISKLNETTGGLLGTLRDLTVTLGMARAAFENMRAVTTGWAGDIIKVNAEMEKLSFLLKGMSQAADPLKEAANQIVFLRDAAKSAPFTLHALTDTFVKIKSTGIDPLKGAFIGLVDGVAAFGGTEQNLARASLAIQEMSGKGVVQTKELRRQLGQDIPRAVEIMSRALGVSQAELSAMMEKGTLEAKGAIASFVGEMERTFGGSALMQMRTFNGMLSQSTTLMQNLALKAGDAGFFSTVKEQMRDMNTLLSSSAAAGFAESLGRGLASVVESLRKGLEAAFEFKNEIIRLGEIIGLALGFRAAIGASQAMIGYLGTLRAEVTMLGIAWSSMQSKMQMAGFARAIGTITQGANGIGLFTQSLRNSASVFAMICTGFAVAAEFVLPLAIALGGLALAFGLLSDHEKDAYDNMVKFGAESQQQVELAGAYLKKQEDILAVMIRQKATQDQAGPYGDWMTETPRMTGAITDHDIEAQKQKNQKIRDNNEKGAIEASKKAAAAQLRDIIDGLDDEKVARSKSYDQAATQRERKYADDLKFANENKLDTKSLQDKYRQDNRVAQLKGYEDEENDLQNHLTASQLMQEMGNVKAIEVGATLDAELKKRLRANNEQMIRLREQPLKPSLTDKPFDLEKAEERLKSKIDELAADSAAKKAEIAGASSEAARLLYMINDAASKSKSLDPHQNAELEEYNSKLLKQLGINEKLAEQLEARNKMETGLLALQRSIAEAMSAAEGGGSKSKVSKMITDMNEGVYSGLTPMQLMKERLASISTSAKDVGEDMRNAFLSVLPPVESVIQKLENASRGFKSLPNGGLNLPGVSSGNSLTDSFIGIESGGRNIKNPNSSASGPGQFTDGTWRDFRKDRYPDTNTSDFMGQRGNMDLVREAIQWRAAQSKAMFEKNNIEPDNANLYLGHMLGPTGATKALSQPDATLVRSIESLREAILHNYDFFKNVATVGQMKDKAYGLTHQSAYKPYYDDDNRQAIPDSGRQGPTSRADRDALERAQIAEQQLNAKKTAAAMTELDRQIDAKIKAAREDNGGKESNYAAGRRLISEGSGPFGRANMDPDDAVYAGKNKRWKEQDQAEAASAERKKSREKLIADTAKTDLLTESQAAKQEDIDAQIRDERKFKFSSEYRNLRRANRAEEIAAQTAVSNGGGTQASADALVAKNAANLKHAGDMEIQAALITEHAKTVTIEKSLMTADEARQKTFQDDVRRNEQYLALLQGTGEERVIVEANVTRNITALRKQQFDLTPIGGMLKTWRDYSNNLQQASTGWMNTFNDKLADMIIKGQASWKGLTDTILHDLVTIALKAAESKLIGSFLGIGVGAAASPAAALAGGTAALHGGGMVGYDATFTKYVHPGIFTGAPKFHSGGFPGLDSSEVPIIAKKGEEVGWPDQLAKKYGGGGGVSQVNNINISGNQAGGPSQNKDLAAQIAAHVQEAARSMVGSELRTQMRPGGTIHAMIKG